MLKIEKFTDPCMTDGVLMHTPSHTNACIFVNFQLTSYITPEMLKL